MTSKTEWGKREITARAARRLLDKLEEIAEQKDGYVNGERENEVWVRLWGNLLDLVASLKVEGLEVNAATEELMKAHVYGKRIIPIRGRKP
jgi:hypothetical protein